MKKIFFLLPAFYFTGNSIYAQCTCGATTENRWGNVELKINLTGAIKKYTCGFQFQVTCRDTVWFRTGVYNCVGTPCTVKYKARLTKAGVLVRTMDPFNFSTDFVSFATAGSYRLEIAAMCNNNLCKSCNFYFTVRDVGCRH